MLPLLTAFLIAATLACLLGWAAYEIKQVLKLP